MNYIVKCFDKDGKRLEHHHCDGTYATTTSMANAIEMAFDGPATMEGDVARVEVTYENKHRA